MAGGATNNPPVPAVGVLDEQGRLDMSSIEDLPYGVYSLENNIGNTVCLGLGDESLIDEKHRIRKRPIWICKAHQEIGAECMGLVTGPNYVAAKCCCNLHNALCNRHGRKQLPITRRFEAWKEDLSREIESLRLWYVSQEDEWRDTWLAKWPKGKQEAILRSQKEDCLLPNRVKMFVKREGGHKCMTKARGIQMYANLATQAEFAVEYTSIQKAVTRLFDGSKDFGRGVRVSFASGMNALELGAWMDDVYLNLRNPHFFERDGKNWDACMQREHQDLKNQLYGVAGQRFLDYVNEQFKVLGTARTPGGTFAYELDGTTKSGHNDTTTGNSIVNAAIAYEAMVTMRLTGRIIVAGDDLLVAVEGDFDEDEFADIERGFGIEPEYAKFKSWSDVSFISGIWMPGRTGFVFCPKPGRLLPRLFWTTKSVSRKKVRAWRHSVASGLRPTCGNLPIIGAWLGKNDPGGTAVEHGKDFHIYRDVHHEVDRHTLEQYFSSRYRVTVEELRECEEWIRNIPIERGLVRHPVLERMADVDNADVDKRWVCQYEL